MQDKQTLNKLVAQVNKLYITYRRHFLQQYANGYSTQKYMLTDKIVEQHLLQKRTIGINLGSQGLTKFMTFDVDFEGNLEKAKAVTASLVEALNSYWGIPLDEIQIDFSGSKGYHVTLFFDKTVQDTSLIPFYREVVAYIGESEKQIEFRCSSSYGMKLPLGLNQKSKRFMCFVSYNPATGQLKHMTKNQSYKHFLTIKQSSFDEFKELVLDDVDVTSLEPKQAEQFESVASEINVDGKSIVELEKELQTVLIQGRLSYQSSRNRITFLLSILFKEQGYELNETIQLINQIMLNTYENYRELISQDTTKEYMLSEIKRISKNTYEKDYSFSTRRKDVAVYRWEIEQILDVKELHLKKLLFSLLLQSKRYGKGNDGKFYMSYSVMQRMGNSKERGALLKYLNQLQERELISIESQNVIDIVRTKLEGTVIKKPNEYKVIMKPTPEQLVIEEKGITIKSNQEMTLQQITSLLIPEKEAKKKLPRRQWENTFKEAYKAI